MKQTQRQRTNLWLPRGREAGEGMDWGLGICRCRPLWGREAGDSQMQMVMYRTDKQQDPTVWHRERYSIFCGKFL